MSALSQPNTEPEVLLISLTDWRNGKYLSKVSLPETFVDPPFQKLGKDQIRILELHPGNRDEELKCSIRICTLDSTARKIMADSDDDFRQRPFDAVSYAWGSPDRKHFLKCNKIIYVEVEMDGEKRLAEMYQEQFDTLVKITENAKDMLIDLRDTQDACSLWIDGICINQDDHEERSEQVKHMRTIYSYAEKVIVWLGTDERNKAPTAFDMARKLASFYHDKALWRMGISHRDDSQEWQVYGFHPWRLSEEDPLYLDQLDYRTLRDDLLSKEWFSRTWVYQELALARVAVLRWEDEEMNWEVLEDATRAITGLSIPLSPFNSGHQAVLNLAKKRQAVLAVRDYVHMYGREDSTSEHHPVGRMLVTELLLEKLLVDVRSLEATDPHDKIYGVLGLLLATEGQEITVNYKVPFRELYIEIAQFLLQNSSPGFDIPLRLLSYVQEQNGDLQIPSWVPDWSTSWATNPICYMGDFLAASARVPSYTFLSHQSRVLQTESPSQRHEEDHSVLQIAAVRVLTIDEIFGITDYKKQAKILTEMPSSYPLTNSTYLSLYLNLFDAKEPADFRLGFHRDNTKSFWKDCLGLIERNVPPCEKPKSVWRSCLGLIRRNANVRAADMDMPSRITADMLHAQFTRTRLEGAVLRPQTREADRPMRDERSRSGFLATNGFMGVVPKKSQQGDWVVLLLGGSVPFVVREGADGYHELIGECYVFGLMDGEGLEQLDESRIEQIMLR